MDKNIFRFKQFEVDQAGCAMRINTDGVLLAALTESNQPQTILDIGTGTGVIALMLAQRFPNAAVEAVEIDEQASITARKNFQSAVFKERLNVVHTAIEHYETELKFDLIVSNPPFFVNDLKNTVERKGIARHTDELFFETLIAKVAALLTETGSFWFILPVKQAELLVEKASAFNLYENHSISLHSDAQKPAFRKLVGLGSSISSPATEHFYIYESEKVYTTAYKNCLKDFFLEY
jgi:tRNA1Val (adenine37-N6)-methyltransferase